MKRIRIGHIGTLHDHSITTMKSLRDLSDRFDVVGFVPESDERYNEIKDKPEYAGVKRMTMDEMLDSGIEAAVIEGFELDNITAAQKCIDRGIHVHIDKPGGEDIDAFAHLLKCAKEKNLVVQMGYMYRYCPAVVKALETVKGGEIGEVYSVEAQMNCLHTVEKRKWLGNFKGGMMFFLGCHLVDLIMLFQGVPMEVTAMNTSVNTDSVTAEDFGMAVFKYPNGVSFAKSTAVEANGFNRRQLVICGSKGTIEIKPLEAFAGKVWGADLISKMRICKNSDAVSWDDCSSEIETPVYNRYNVMMEEFAKYVSGEKENPYSYEYELSLQKVILAACGCDIDYK